MSSLFNSSTLANPDPNVVTLFLLITFIASGVLYSAWMLSPLSKPFNTPVDGGRTFRGKRIFGDNKTYRGFTGMALAVGLMFLLFGWFQERIPGLASLGMWPLSPFAYAALGIWVGLGFMAGELPNSFCKRQLNIPPGYAAASPGWRVLFLFTDRVDSILGMMVALSMMVPVPVQTWWTVLIVGPAIHLGFSALLFLLKVKRRFA